MSPRAHMSRSDVRRLLQRPHLVTVPRATGSGVATLAPPGRQEHHAESIARPAGIPPRRSPEKTYVGTIVPVSGQSVVVVIGADDSVRPLQPISLQPSGFEWGSRSAGANALALAILADAVGYDDAIRLYVKYVHEVVSQITAAHFVLRLSDVRAWHAVRAGCAD